MASELLDVINSLPVLFFLFCTGKRCMALIIGCFAGALVYPWIGCPSVPKGLSDFYKTVLCIPILIACFIDLKW